MNATIKEQALRQANTEGLRHRTEDVNEEWETMRCYYDQIMQVAYDLGRCNGISLSDAPIVEGYRWGAPPESGISMNHADQTSEKGCSVAWLKSDPNQTWGQWSWAKGLDRYEITGILVPEMTGSDGEPLLLLLTGDTD